MPDLKEVLEALDRCQHELPSITDNPDATNYCNGCPYYGRNMGLCCNLLMRDAMKLLKRLKGNGQTMIYKAEDVLGMQLESTLNKMGCFILPLVSDENKRKIYDIAAKAYEDWMAEENDSEQTAIGDYIIEMLRKDGYEEGEHYEIFFNHDWD